MALRTKLYLAFTLMIILTVATSVIAINAFRNANQSIVQAKRNIDFVSRELIPANNHWINISAQVINAGMNFYAYAYTFKQEDYQRADAEMQALMKEMASLEGALAKSDPSRLQDSRAALVQCKKDAEELSRLGAQLRDCDNRIRAKTAEFIVVQDELSALSDEQYNAASDSQKELVGKAIDDPSELDRRTDRLDFFSHVFDSIAWGGQAFWRGLGKRGGEAREFFDESQKNMSGLLSSFGEFIQSGHYPAPEDQALARKFQDGAKANVRISGEIEELYLKVDELTVAAQKLSERASDQVRAVSRNVASQVVAVTQTIDEENTAIAAMGSTAEQLLFVALGVAIVVGLLLAWFIVRSIANPIDAVIRELRNGEKIISGAADSIAQASNNLADGANEQASALEETSSALEQIASMTRMAADNANRTNQQTRDTVKLVREGSQSMQEMAGAMHEINERSEKVGQIIKTIEDIAFQTNLLALNAAVEAARAGEAGKGFAVVADEVRNLSQRSAAAARDTTALIQGTVESIHTGSGISERLAESYRQIEKGAGGMGDLIEQIANAANEQAQGVEQVNNAVAQMEKVTQQNSSASEETASASNSMTDQMTDMRETILHLSELVYGKGIHVQAAPEPHSRPARKKSAPAKAAPMARARVEKIPPPTRSEPQVMRPNEVIPLEGDEF